jgi:hypothetical protein
MSANEHDCGGCSEYNRLSRRGFLSGAAGAAATSFFPIFPDWLPKVVLAEAADSSRDVIV